MNVDDPVEALTSSVGRFQPLNQRFGNVVITHRRVVEAWSVNEDVVVAAVTERVISHIRRFYVRLMLISRISH